MLNVIWVKRFTRSHSPCVFPFHCWKVLRPVSCRQFPGQSFVPTVVEACSQSFQCSPHLPTSLQFFYLKIYDLKSPLTPRRMHNMVHFSNLIWKIMSLKRRYYIELIWKYWGEIITRAHMILKSNNSQPNFCPFHCSNLKLFCFNATSHISTIPNSNWTLKINTGNRLHELHIHFITVFLSTIQLWRYDSW